MRGYGAVFRPLPGALPNLPKGFSLGDKFESPSPAGGLFI